MKQSDGQKEHQQRADHPVLHQRQQQNSFVAEHAGHLFVAHLGQRRVHHQNQADGDGDVGGAYLGTEDQLLNLRQEVPRADADNHRCKNPESKVAIKK